MDHMKSKYWIVLIGAVLLICSALSLFFFLPGQASMTAEIWSDNELVRTVDLRIDQSFTIETEHGYNTVTVKDGAIAVTASDCPDCYCMHRGYCNSGAPIVCLPHRLVIQFLQSGAIDGISG
ncbi:MAG: NusG domain II-containing protein [Ruminococcaceae bacterium]|nr:NusG domain II-containing protein [Oscillospiraceae bacterium]